MLNQKELSKLIKGEIVNHFLLLKKCEVKTTTTNKNYLLLELGDQSQVLTGFLWDGFEEFQKVAVVGCVVKVSGEINEFNSKLNIKINSIRCCDENDGVSVTDFIPKSKREISVMEKELKKRVDRISNFYIKSLLNLILEDSVYEKFVKVPAGKAWHHAYIHGLLEHTLEIIRICDLMCDIHYEINRDLLICAAILHDLGKVEELTFDGNFDYSDKGKLIGHIVISAMLINEKSKLIEGFPEELKNQIIHLVLSHQGKLEFASPVVPKMLEAIVLYHADELSAKTNAYKCAIENDANGNNKWTKYLSLVSTSLYIPEEYGKSYEEVKESLFD